MTQGEYTRAPSPAAQHPVVRRERVQLDRTKPNSGLDGAETPDRPALLPGLPRQPDSRSPLEVVHSEEYLLQCLVRHYHWHWAAAGVLRRPSR